MWIVLLRVDIPNLPISDIQMDWSGFFYTYSLNATSMVCIVWLMNRCRYVEIVHRISEWVFMCVVKSRAQDRRQLVEAIWYCSNSADSVFIVDWWLQLHYDASEWVDTESYAAFEEFGDRYIQFQQHAYLFALPLDIIGDSSHSTNKLHYFASETTRWRILHSQLS